MKIEILDVGEGITLIETDIKRMGRPGYNRRYYVRFPKDLMYDGTLANIEDEFLILGKTYDFIFDEHIRIRDQIRKVGTMFYLGIPKPYINKKTLEIGKTYEILIK